MKTILIILTTALSFNAYSAAMYKWCKKAETRQICKECCVKNLEIKKTGKKNFKKFNIDKCNLYCSRLLELDNETLDSGMKLL